MSSLTSPLQLLRLRISGAAARNNVALVVGSDRVLPRTG